MSCGVGRRCGPDLALLWLWCRPAAVAQIRPLAWEPPYATGAALKMTKKKKRKRKKERKIATEEMVLCVLHLPEGRVCIWGGTFMGWISVQYEERFLDVAGQGWNRLLCEGTLSRKSWKLVLGLNQKRVTHGYIMILDSSSLCSFDSQ